MKIVHMLMDIKNFVGQKIFTKLLYAIIGKHMELVI
jgi:hypothetical protein